MSGEWLDFLMCFHYTLLLRKMVRGGSRGHALAPIVHMWPLFELIYVTSSEGWWKTRIEMECRWCRRKDGKKCGTCQPYRALFRIY